MKDELLRFSMSLEVPLHKLYAAIIQPFITYQTFSSFLAGCIRLDLPILFFQDNLDLEALRFLQYLEIVKL